MFATMRKALKKEKGMIDIESVMTGVIITAILGAVVSASLIVVVPWFQDKTAQDDVNLIKIAQESHQADTGLYTNDVAVLKSKNYLHKTNTLTCIDMASPTANEYTIYVKSKSGRKYQYTPSMTEPIVISVTAPVPCTLK